MANKLSELEIGDGVTVYYDKENGRTVLETEHEAIWLYPAALSNFVYWISHHFNMEPDSLVKNDEEDDTDI